jgi:hypothetical protein
VEPIAVAFDSKTPTFVTLRYEVDPIAATGHLGFNTKAAPDDFVEHLELESGLAPLTQNLHLARVLHEWLVEMSNQLSVERVFLEGSLGHRAE